VLRSLPRLVIGCAAAAGGVVAVALTAALVGSVWLGSGAGERWVEGQLEQRVSALTDGGQLTIGRLDLGLSWSGRATLLGASLRDVALTDRTGRALVAIDQVIAELRPMALAERTVRVPHLRVIGADVELRADGDGVLDIVRLFGGPSASPSDEPFSLPVALDLPDVDAQGLDLRFTTAAGAVWEVAGVDGQLAVSGSGGRIALSDLRIAGLIASPGPVPVRAAGEIVFDGSEGLLLDRVSVEVPRSAASVRGRLGQLVDLVVDVDQLDARAIDPLAGGIGLAGRWRGELTARGEQEVAITAALRGIDGSAGAGRVQLEGRVQRDEPVLAYTAAAELSDFHVQALLSTIAEPVVVGGTLQVQGRGTSLATASVDGRWLGGAQTLYGQAIDRVDAPFRLRGGELSLQGAALEGIVGDLVVDGAIHLQRGPMDLTVRGALSPERLAALGAPGLVGDGEVEATIRGDWKASDPIEAAGAVRYAPFVYGDMVTMASLSAPFDLRIDGGEVRGQVGVAGRGLEAIGATASGVDASGLRLVVQGADVTVTGSLAVAGLDWAGYATAADSAVELRYAKRAAHQQVDAAVALTDYTLAGRPGTDGAVTVAMRDDDLRFDVALDDYGRRVLTTGGSYDVATAELALDHVSFAPTPRATWTNTGPARLRVVDGGVADARLMLESELGAVAITGDLGTRGPLDGRIQVAGLQLDHLAELYPERLEGTGGTLDAVIALQGDGADPVVDADLDLRGLYVEGAVRWLDVDGEVRLAGGQLRPDLSLGVAGERFAVVRGQVPLAGGMGAMALDQAAPVDLSVAIVPGSIERLARVAPSLDGAALPEGRLSAVIRATESLGDPVLHLAGVSEVAVPGWKHPGRVELDVTRRASDLAFSADLRQGLATRALLGGEGTTRLGDVVAHMLTGEGEAPDYANTELYLADMAVSAALVGVPAASLAAMAGSDLALSGELVGGVSLSGSPMKPVVDGAINWLSPQLGATRIDGAYVAFVPHEAGGYALDLALAFPEGGNVEVHGRVPVVPDLAQPVETWAVGDLQLDVSGHGIPLGALTAFDPRLRDGRGVVAIEGTVSGSPFAPRPAVTARIAGGEVSYRDLGITAEDIDALVAMDGDRIRLDHADFALVPTRRIQALDNPALGPSSGKGRPRVSVVGITELREDGLGTIDARVTLTDGPWLASTDSTKLRADGSIRLAGEWPALSATGDLDVVYGRLQLDASVLSDDTPLRIDPALTIHRSEREHVPAPPVEPPFYADFDVDITVDLNRNLELSMAMPFVDDLGEVGAALSSADLSTRLGGQLQVAMANQEPTLVGEVEVVEGKVRVLRSNLALEEGTISFAGGDPYTDANLDLSGVMAVEGGELELSIRGPLPAPTFETRSEAFPDPAEQWTILLTGQSPAELSSGQAEGAAQALAGLFVNSLLSGKALGTLSIEPDNSVRLGVPVTPSVYARSTFAPFADFDDNALSLELEWSLARRVVASGGIGDQVQWGDLFWEIRF
jgi:autotransporter translocation and assembly factor TamB